MEGCWGEESIGMKPDLDRREFLKLGAAAGLSTLLASCNTKERWTGHAYRKTATSRVAILQAGGYEENLVEKVKDGIKAFNLPVTGKRVLLKPNLVEYEKDTVINTHPALVGAAAEAFLALGASEVLVGEGPGHRRDMDGLLGDSGLLAYLKDTRTAFIDLNVDDIHPVKLLSRFAGIESLYFPDSVLKADLLVSMPKIKTHHWAGMTLAMKNLFGIVPGVKYGWPKNFLHWHGIHQSIVDINSTIRPRFVIADGIVAMEGNGPIQGKPKHCGVLVMGDDLVAVDSTCARIAGLKPEKISYLQIASEYLGNLDEAHIQQIGVPLARVQQSFEVIDNFRYLKG